MVSTLLQVASVALSLFGVASALPAAPPASLTKRGFSGRATFYYVDVGLGACGQQHSNSDYTVALNSAQYGGGYPGPQCFKTITISYGGKTAQATIADECPTCGYGDLDFSPGLFNYFASESVGQFQMTWDFGSSASAPEPTTQKAAEPTSTYVAPAPATTPTSTYTPPAATSETPQSTYTSSAAAVASASATAAVVSRPSNSTVESLSNLEDLSQVIAQLGQLIITGASMK